MFCVFKLIKSIFEYTFFYQICIIQTAQPQASVLYFLFVDDIINFVITRFTMFQFQKNI